jgi:hypothetical protein
MGTWKVLLLTLGIMLAVCCGGSAIVAAVNSGKTTNTSSRNGGDTPAAGGSAAAAPTGAAKTTGGGGGGKANPKLNQPVRDGKFEFTVTKVQCGVTKVGDEYLNKAAQGQYCLITVNVKNIGNEARTFTGANQHAFGAGGVKYDNDGAAEIYANSQTQTFLEQINPGNGVTGVLVFDIPKDATITRFELHDSAFSGGVSVDNA